MQDSGKESKTVSADLLFEKIREGDQEALKSLFSVYFPRLNDFARRVVRDDILSQDIVQDVFLQVWEKRAGIQPVHIEAYLFRLVRNRCLDHIRHIRVVSNTLHALEVDSRFEELYRIDFLGNEPYVLIEKELKDKIDQTIQELPERCREVFVLSRMEGLKNQEIANRLGISIKNVERHLTRAFRQFRESFPDELPAGLIILVLTGMQI
jgi:RNA polymerase sigma-70 factor, ECF subfamily